MTTASTSFRITMLALDIKYRTNDGIYHQERADYWRARALVWKSYKDEQTQMRRCYMRSYWHAQRSGFAFAEAETMRATMAALTGV